MIYCAKMIHTLVVGEDERRFYEELILRVEAESSDEAFEKAEKYMQDNAWDHINPAGQRVRTLQVEAVECYISNESEEDVQELYSLFSVNKSGLPEEEYYQILRATLSKEERYPLRNIEFNGPKI